MCLITITKNLNNFDKVKFIEDLEYEKHDVLLSLMVAKNEFKGEVITTYSDILFEA